MLHAIPTLVVARCIPVVTCDVCGAYLGRDGMAAVRGGDVTCYVCDAPLSPDGMSLELCAVVPEPTPVKAAPPVALPLAPTRCTLGPDCNGCGLVGGPSCQRGTPVPTVAPVDVPELKLTYRMVPGVCGKCKARVPVGGFMGLSPKGALWCASCLSVSKGPDVAAPGPRGSVTTGTLQMPAAVAAEYAPVVPAPVVEVPLRGREAAVVAAAAPLPEDLTPAWPGYWARRDDGAVITLTCRICGKAARNGDADKLAVAMGKHVEAEHKVYGPAASEGHPMGPATTACLTCGYDAVVGRSHCEACAAAIASADARRVLDADAAQQREASEQANREAAVADVSDAFVADIAAAVAAPVVEVKSAAPAFESHVDAVSLRAAVTLCAAAVDPKSTMPVLANVLLRCDAGRLTVEATDLNVHVSAPVVLAGSGTGTGAYTVNAKVLKDAAPKKGTAWIDCTGLTPFVTVDGMSLVGLSAAEYPVAPALATETRAVPRESLLAFLTETVAAVATDASRYHLSGTMLGTRDGAAVAVATDGHRLHLRSGGDIQWPWSQDIIVPLKGVQVLIRALKAAKGVRDVAVGVTGLHTLTVIAGDYWTVRIKLVDAQFPPYEMVIPKTENKEGRVNVDRRELDAALAKCGRLASNRVQSVKLTSTAGRLTVSSDNPDKGTASVDLPCTCEGKALSIGINAVYLRDWLAVCEADTVALDFAGALDPLVVHPMGTRYALSVAMPLRL